MDQFIELAMSVIRDFSVARLLGMLVGIQEAIKRIPTLTNEYSRNLGLKVK